MLFRIKTWIIRGLIVAALVGLGLWFATVNVPDGGSTRFVVITVFSSIGAVLLFILPPDDPSAGAPY